MKELLNDLDKEIGGRVRLCIVSLLSKYGKLDFNTFKKELGLTDGNLASHMNALEKAEYITVTKKFVAKKPNTSYSLSELGRISYRKHMLALESLVKEMHKRDEARKSQ